MDETNLPAGFHLAYYVAHEAWSTRYTPAWARVGDGRPTIQVSASAEGGRGCAWEFSVSEHDLGQPTPVVRMFNDSWPAYTQIPGFFAALAGGEVKTLDDVRTLLDRMGAVDETERTER